jgi:hypothetical protein
MIVVLEAAAATHGDEPGIPDLGEDHPLPASLLCPPRVDINKHAENGPGRWLAVRCSHRLGRGRLRASGWRHRYTRRDMADDSLFSKVQLQTPQIESDRGLLRDEDLLNEEHLRRMDQVLLRRNLDHARMFSRKYSLELQQYVHLYTPEANELRRKIEQYMVMERMIEREMARRHTY